MIKVSVIIPAYNAERHLRECLNSVLNQSLKDIEVICIDDESVDNTLNILEKYAGLDSRVKVHKGAHKGGGAARNIGLAVAKGEYIAFLDADDFMGDKMLENLYEKSKACAADIIICGVRFLFQATGALRDVNDGLRLDYLPEKDVFSYRDMPASIFNTFHNWPWNKMFNRSFLEKHDLKFQEILRTNDLLFTNKALILAERITVVKEHLVTYRMDTEADNCQNTNQIESYGFYEAFLALQQFLQEQNIYQLTKQSFVNHALDGGISNLNTLSFGAVQESLFNRLKNEIFKALDVDSQPDDYYYSYLKEVPTLSRYRQMQKGNYQDFVCYRANELSGLFRGLQHDIYLTDVRTYRQQREIFDLNIAIRSITSYMQYFVDDNEAVYQSFSYRFGHSITKFPRWVRRKLTRGSEEHEENSNGYHSSL